MIICGTGHRPNKLGGYSIEVYSQIEGIIVDYLDDLGGDQRDDLTIISGGALGWDQCLASAASRWNIPYKMYLPFLDFDSKWPKSSRDHLNDLCSTAKEVRYVCDGGYAPWKMQVRNEAMVNDSDLVLAYWDGSAGGTYNCIRYAEKVGKPIVNLKHG
jgi:uncharacterized phage-like protein YoqJ